MAKFEKVFQCKTSKHPGAISEKELTVQRGTRNLHAIIKLSGTETVSRPDASKCTDLSCRNEEAWLWALWFREARRRTQITPKPGTIAVSWTHPSPSKEGKVAKQDGWWCKHIKDCTGILRIFCIARPSCFRSFTVEDDYWNKESIQVVVSCKGSSCLGQDACYQFWILTPLITTLTCHPSFLENV